MPIPVETNNDQLTGKDDKNNDDLLYPYDSPLEMINNELGTFLSLKAKLVEVTEEHKISMALNAKTVNSLVKMHEKTQEALDEKTNELAKIKEELQTVNLTNLELLQKLFCLKDPIFHPN